MKSIRIILPVIVLMLVAASGALAQSFSAEATANFKSQLAVVEAKKEARTAVQKKINGDIVDYLHEVILKDTPVLLPKLQHNVELNAANEVTVDIKANVSDSLISLIKNQGGTIINAFPEYQAIRVRIPITSVETIAANPDVIFIDKAEKGFTNQQTVSEGYVAHNVPVARSKGYDGQGIKVGVLSDSIQSSNANPLDYIEQVIATGDLPATVYYVTGQAGDPTNNGSGEGEGVAMLEIVYDLAPKATLYFATAAGGTANYANNIKILANQGCKVIIDDYDYPTESPFQDDVVSQAVTTAINSGVAYFSAAINNGNFYSNHSGTWEGDFHDSGYTFNGDTVHTFSGSAAVGNQILSDTGSVSLFWSDPLGKSSNDYDLYVVDNSLNIVASSANPQTGTQDPYESIAVNGDLIGYYVLITNYKGLAAPRFLHLEVGRSLLYYATNGSTKGHPTLEAAYGVAATDAKGRITPFTGSEPVEYFSSDGPRRVFYNPDGSAITSGNLSSTGGKLRYKPDLMAANGVACSANYPNFDPFYGTSAAAPHAGAIAACLLSARPNLTPAALRKALTQGTLPTPPTWNNYAGYGIVMADRALNLLPKAVFPAGISILLLH